MTDRILRKLDFSGKLLLGTAGVLAIAAPIFIGLANPTPTQAQSREDAANAPAFADVSIKPSDASVTQPMIRFMYGPAGLTGNNITLQRLIQDAYGVQASQISGAPDWLSSEKFDIQAKLPQSAVDEHPDPAQSWSQRKLMMRSLLAERFKLVVHSETKNLPVYALTVAESGFKLQPVKADDSSSSGMKTPEGLFVGRGNMMMGKGMVTGQALPVADLAHLLSEQLGRPVLDKTGLTGKYDFSLQWAAAGNELSALAAGESGSGAASSASQPAASGPSLFEALQQQLGLKLEPQQSPMETLVIDHVEQLAEN